MKHKILNIRNDLDTKIYNDYDSFAIKRIIYDDIEKIGHHFYDNFYKFNSDVFDRRVESSEESLIEAFKLKYEFGALNSDESKSDKKWPLPRVLAGLNTNLNIESTQDLFIKWKVHPLHFTFEHVEW